MTEFETAQLKLMVVDDEADNLDLLYRTFRRDFQVFKAESGSKALQVLEDQGEMAVIISDQRMPRMNGTEFLSRTVERFPDTIRILLTGYTDVEDLVGAINAGQVFKYITKPWNPKDLKATVTQASETYRVVKQRTSQLHRALRRESIFNTVNGAIRASVDYRNILQAVVQTVSQCFAADRGWLWSVEDVAAHQPYRPSCQLSNQVLAYSASASPDPINPDPASQTPASPLLPALERLMPLLQSQPAPPISKLSDGQILLSLTYQQQPLALLMLCRQLAWSDEEIELIAAVADQAALAMSQARLYQRIQDQSEQMRSELAVARQIQTYLLRQSLPASEQVKIQAHCFPAQEVGGDFFETYAHPQGDIWLAVGDVSGKGVPAALFMASALSLLRRELSQESPPAANRVLQNLNASLYDNLCDSNRFITMALACYSPASQRLTYANAGHLYPMVWNSRALTDAPTYLKTRGVPLGILPIWTAEVGQLPLGSGEALLLLSDGITEATKLEPAAAASTMLHQSGLWELIRQQLATGQALDLEALLSEIQAQTQAQEDDQTILSLEVL
ncbi:MAG: SpoIIE family protein phosphatase [Pegethrix bostrychoides GSE-TBD4-15B]|jgi:serine phosphatase RsbU (regulator of sigma subunit)/CheY-like chemotaxis protein|uniref:SpoIIE family protein phosphatase n=1 Tax=Pegethrix bostrychoides GSE-TBD4-15B TaxID=2839662 RepID=A0A951PC28_9CYAN|nr:SpoIIE family protein phosphatase [Pegethrix bostrychoides GSE-TBD4-15B]